MSDGSIGGSMQWILWYASELAFKWVPGTIVSLIESQGSGVTAQSPQLPLITQPVSVLDIVHFLQITSLPGTYDHIFYWWEILVSISTVFSLIAAAVLIFCTIRLRQIHAMEHDHLHALQHSVAHHDLPKTETRWQHIEEQANTENPQSWRLAVLEADIMLAELFDTLGYKGDTLGDRMRSVDRGRFNSIDLAWEAHRFRNRIAHEGNSMQVEGREVRRIIGLYEKVFKEFGFVV